MSKIQKCKGAADFLRVVYEKHYQKSCPVSKNPTECFRTVHYNYNLMAEAYVSNSPFKSEELNRCFLDDFNELIQEIAAEYEMAKSDIPYTLDDVLKRWKDTFDEEDY
jgi:hypothetical protein